MAVRTLSADVLALMAPGEDYNLSSPPDLTGFILTANKIVSRVATCATAKGLTLDSEELELIERWLSAHFYVMSDQNYTSKSTGGQSASFQGKTDMSIAASKYGQAAMNVDYSGCLTAISKRQFAGVTWLGKTASEQLTWEQRNGSGS